MKRASRMRIMASDTGKAMREIQLYKRAVSCQTCGWLRTARSYATCKFTEEIAIVPQASVPYERVQ